jgi:hypothetical protein
VRQGDKEHVARANVRREAELESRTTAQVGMDVIDILAEVRLGGDLGDLDVGMVEQDAQQFAAGVSRTADDGCLNGCVHAVYCFSPFSATART